MKKTPVEIEALASQIRKDMDFPVYMSDEDVLEATRGTLVYAVAELKLATRALRASLRAAWAEIDWYVVAFAVFSLIAIVLHGIIKYLTHHAPPG